MQVKSNISAGTTALCGATLVLTLFPFTSRGEAVADPVRDMLSMVHSTNEDLLEVKADLGNNGGNEILLSFTGQTNGQAGNMWTAYIPENGGYVRLDEPLNFREDAISIVKSATGAKALVTYWPSSAEEGAMITYGFDGKLFFEANVKEIEPNGKDHDLYLRFFGNSEKSPVTVITAQQLRSLPLPSSTPQLVNGETRETQFTSIQNKSGLKSTNALEKTVLNPRQEGSSSGFFLVVILLAGLGILGLELRRFLCSK